MAEPGINPTNINNPNVLPIHTPESEQLLNNIKNSPTLFSIKWNVYELFKHLNDRSYFVDEMVVKV